MAADPHEAGPAPGGRGVCSLSVTEALGGASDHGVSKSLYGPRSRWNEFEIMWRSRARPGATTSTAGVIRPLDIEREVARFGGVPRVETGA